jgi:Response regulator containing CheY-like receiver, AAA-type ATPase, and DNA-binding domains
MKKALVVDDTKNIRTLLSMCLELEGYQVTIAGNGKEALTLLQGEAQFDLAFLDIKLPEMPGTEVLRNIRKQGNNTPIIIMTAFATVKNAIECTKLGAVVYLQKPFTADKVRHVLQEVSEDLKINPGEIKNFHTTAKSLMADGEYEQSFLQLKKALAIDPGCGETYRLIAQLYEARGDKKEAERFNLIAQQFQS